MIFRGLSCLPSGVNDQTNKRAWRRYRVESINMRRCYSLDTLRKYVPSFFFNVFCDKTRHVSKAKAEGGLLDSFVFLCCAAHFLGARTSTRCNGCSTMGIGASYLFLVAFMTTAYPPHTATPRGGLQECSLLTKHKSSIRYSSPPPHRSVHSQLTHIV